jgi:hypothetical protein
MIKFNEVTWYSKLIAIIFFIGVFPALCFYIGNRYGEVKELYQAIPNESYSKAENNSVNMSDWKTYKSDLYGYEIKLPPGYEVVKDVVGTLGVPDIERINYSDKDHSFRFQVYARNTDWIMKDCLKSIDGKDISETKEINGNTFFAFKKDKEVLGNRNPVPGSIESEYRIIHDGQCYFIDYSIFPESSISSMNTKSQFNILSQIFSTFRFIKPTVKVISPNITENFVFGKPGDTITTIKWSTTNFADMKVVIGLVDGSGNRGWIKTIADNVPNTGSYIWVADPTLVSGKYKIVVTSPQSIVNASIGPLVSDESDTYFNLTFKK